MGREVRRVPPDWKHPEDRALYDTLRKRREELEQWERGLMPDYRGGWVKRTGLYASMKAKDYFGSCNKRDFMPDWPVEKCTHYQMYENTTEGTPISPVMSSPEELARWLADNNASAFGGMTASYEGWLATIKSQHGAAGLIIGPEGSTPCVEAMKETPKRASKKRRSPNTREEG